MHPANEGQRYSVTSSPIGWAHTQNDPCITQHMNLLKWLIFHKHMHFVLYIIKSKYSLKYFSRYLAETKLVHQIHARKIIQWSWTWWVKALSLQWTHMSIMASLITSNWAVCFNSLFMLTTKKTSKFHITGLLWGKPTHHQWFSLTKDQ